MPALTTITFSITGEGIGKYVEVESGGINVVTWSGIEWDTVYTEWDLYLKNKKKAFVVCGHV